MYSKFAKLTVILIDPCLMALGSQFLLRVDWWYSWYQRFLVNKFHRIFECRFFLGRTARNNLLQFVDW